MEKIMKKAFSPRNQKIILCFLVILISISFIRSTLTSTQTYKTVIQSIDEKRATVMQLVAASTAASAVITVIPDDVGTPIAQQLAELSKYFIIVLSALYLEKYLLTIIGFISSTVLLPGASLLFFSYIMHPESEWKRKFAIKLLIQVLLLFLLFQLVFGLQIQLKQLTMTRFKKQYPLLSKLKMP